MQIPIAQYSDTLVTNINNYLASLEFQFQRSLVNITTQSLAVQLSAQFSTPIYPAATDSIVAQPVDFFKTLQVNVSSF
jgi:hypothetical protein